MGINNYPLLITIIGITHLKQRNQQSTLLLLLMQTNGYVGHPWNPCLLADGGMIVL